MNNRTDPSRGDGRDNRQGHGVVTPRWMVRKWGGGIRIAVCAAVVVVAGCASTTAQRFQAHVDYLASDKLEGRGVGTTGIELAKDYIAEQFEIIGLDPAGENGTYFQTFDMPLDSQLTEAARLSVEVTSTPRALKLHSEFTPFSFSSNEEFQGELVFCGYAIDAPDKQRSDFAHLDVAGKVLLAFRGEPQSWADAEGTPTRHAMLRNKVYNAKDRGAVGILFVNQRPEEGEADALDVFEPSGAEQYGLPAIQITRSVANGLLADGGLDSLDELQSKLDSGDHGSAALAGVNMSGWAGLERAVRPTSNVVGLLKGNGTQSGEYVVVSAHYDHLGVRRPMMRRFKDGKIVHETPEPQIHNGADDNASGVSGVIEIARLFCHARRTARSILFIAFTAEETGLQGSKYFVEHPPVPLDDIVGAVNLDMIGRLDPRKQTVQIFSARSGKEFEQVIRAAASDSGLRVELASSLAGASDHASFVRSGVPGIHLFTGHHSDYHQPSDDADKINAAGGADTTRLAYLIAREVADREERLTFEEPKADARMASGTPVYRVVMGLTPGYAEDGEPGMLVEAVNDGGPAALAGMAAKDRIIRINDKAVANIYDYMAATRENKPGDTVHVVVLRDGQEVGLEVKLAGAGG